MINGYDDFDLAFHLSDENYDVQLLNSPVGQADGKFALPYSQAYLQTFYFRIGQLNRAVRRVDNPDLAAAKEFGASLFQATFKGELLGRFRASADRTRVSGRGLRLRLRLKSVPALAELPWEFLYDIEQDHFLATSAMTPVVRFLDLSQRVSPLRVRLPLQILVVISGPRNLGRLKADDEWDRVKHSLRSLESAGLVKLERLPTATFSELRRRARGVPFHVLHFIGHGGFDKNAGDGVLHFEDSMGMSDPIPGNLLGNILRDHSSLRLAVLNACEGGRQTREDPFSGVAQSLCQQLLPAVIAMQFEISDDAAKTFAEEFYAAIADRLPIDAAVSESRKALFGGRFGQEWATPVLYMRSSDGLLFDVNKKSISHGQRLKGSRSRAEADRVAAEKADREAKAEADRVAAEKADRETRAEADRVAAEKADRETKAEADRVAAEKADRETRRKPNAGTVEPLTKSSLPDLYRQAKEGDQVAMLNLGFAHLQGLGVDKDDHQAAAWFRKAAEAGSPVGMWHLGTMYADGRGVEKEDDRQAIYWYLKAAEAGDANGLRSLGWVYQHGRGVDKDDHQAAIWYRKAAEAGDTSAMRNLALMYTQGRGIWKDDDEAFLWYLRAAKAGDVWAMRDLGLVYAKGSGVKKDDRQAFAWVQKAAQAGDAQAMRDLGLMYVEGRGVERDDYQAFVWVRRAAEAGDAQAMKNLGLMYLEGRGVEKDDHQAVAWIRKAAENGNSSGMSSLGWLYSNGHGLQKDDRQAFLWYLKAAEAGNPNAMSSLGWMYLDGRGVEKDYREAVVWCRKAAKAENAFGMAGLAWAYETGRGVVRDIVQAVAWYREAAKLGDQTAKDALDRLEKSEQRMHL
jgi:TPR repeat protein